jgi:hypothetical protein
MSCQFSNFEDCHICVAFSKEKVYIARIVQYIYIIPDLASSTFPQMLQAIIHVRLELLYTTPLFNYVHEPDAEGLVSTNRH